MISVNFEYHKPNSIIEAVEIFWKLNKEGKEPLFYNGGTEIITMLRVNALYIKTKAVIDIKEISECRYIGFRDDRFVIGSSIPLAQLEKMSEFPLLSKNCGRIADHTSRQKITLGGNICGKIKYKEAILPLLLTDCELVIASESGLKEISIHRVFDQQINLDPGAFIAQIRINKQFLELPYVSKKMTKIGRIGYPLLTVSAIQAADQTRFAFSGLCDFPFRSKEMEETLNKRDISIDERITEAIRHIPAPIVNDLHGSSAYREFVLKNVLEETIAELEGDEDVYEENS